MDYMEPMETKIDFESGEIFPCDNKIVRKLSEMKNMFSDKAAYEKELSLKDRIVYEVFERKVPHETGQLVHSTTVIYPGKVGNEYYMTKGHFHEIEDRSELYFCLNGEGYVVMQTKEGEFSSIRMTAGVVAYIPPYWAHRTINTGKDNFVFFTVYPADAGHNYGAIEKTGFPNLVVEKDGQPAIVNNSGWQKE